MLLSEIATRVKRTFGDEAGAQITDQDIIRWANDAQREIAVNNDLLQVTATTATVAGQDQYALPPDLLTLKSVRFQGRRLSSMTSAEMGEMIGSDAVTRGIPTHFSVFAKKIDLYPAPDSSDPDDLQVYYTRQPMELMATTDTPELPAQYHNRIVEYCIAQAYELDDNLESSQKKMQQFEDGVARLKGVADWQDQDVYPSISVSANDCGDGGGYYYA